MRNRASPDIMRRYASSAFSKESVSIMGRTSVRTLKSRVSCVSIALPVRLPTTERPPKMSGTPLTGMGSPETPTATKFAANFKTGKQATDCGPAWCGRKDDIRASELLQCCRRVLCLGIDVDVRSEFLRQMLFVGAPTNRHGTQAHFSRKLHAKVAKSTDSLNGNGVAGTCGVTKRIEGCYAGTYQGGCIF